MELQQNGGNLSGLLANINHSWVSPPDSNIQGEQGAKKSWAGGSGEKTGSNFSYSTDDSHHTLDLLAPLHLSIICSVIHLYFFKCVYLVQSALLHQHVVTGHAKGETVFQLQ